MDHLDTASNSGAARTFTYTYKANSSLVDSYYVGASATANFAMGYDYDTTSAARRSVIDGKYLGASLTRFDLGFDSRGYVRSAKQTGSAFADYATASYPATYNFSTYDERGQVKSSARFRGTPPTSASPGSADQLPGRRFEYRYDAAGNRTLSGQVDPDDSTISATDKANLNDSYTLKPNGLNQYLTKENKSVRVLGTAAANAAVAAQNSTGATAPVTKLDRSYAVSVLSLNNVSGPAQGDVTVYAALAGQGSGGSDLVATQPRKWQTAQQVQTMSYDYDGNLSGDGVWTYAYDAENRLAAMETTTTAVSAGLRYQLLEFKYDYMGRRIQKRSKQAAYGAFPATDVYLGYVYDGWNLVAEFTIDNPTTSPTCGTMLRSFTWGLDLAGSTSATGGIGALVQISDYGTGKSYFPTYDGNGNVIGFVDMATGTKSATYDYNAFGETIQSDGVASAANHFRFSTKYTDDETGLLYYGYRYYTPSTGRLLNRDPAEEQGGENLYVFVRNNPNLYVDVLGAGPYTTGPEALAVLAEAEGPLMQQAAREGAQMLAREAAVRAAAAAAGVAVTGALSGDTKPSCPTCSNNPAPNAPNQPAAPAPGGKYSSGLQQQKEQERTAYKKRCTEFTPPRLVDRCEIWKWKLQRNKDCKRMREEFGKKWYNDNEPGHVQVIRELEVAIKTLEDNIKKYCQPCPPANQPPASSTP